MSQKVTSVKANRVKRKGNLTRLCNEMNKMVNDAVDREIVKRFKTTIDTEEEDIAKKNLDTILSSPNSITVSEYNESLQPYLKHYLFMLKRNRKKEMTA